MSLPDVHMTCSAGMICQHHTCFEANLSSMWHSLRECEPNLMSCCRSHSTSAANTGKERLQRSVLHMREGAVGEELVGLAFKGAYVNDSSACVRTLRRHLAGPNAIIC